MVIQDPIISVIVVTWNSQGEIVACLRSLERALRIIPHEIIVVDNQSTDDTCIRVKRNAPSVRLIRAVSNTGFGAGNNTGLRYATGKFILLINPDTIANAPATLTLWNFLEEHPRVGVVGPEQTDASGRFLFTTSKFSIRGLVVFGIEELLWHMTRTRHIVFSPIIPVCRLNAGCVLARRDIFGKTRQWFDPALFLYGEEFTFFPRVRAAGWQIYFLRHVRIIHHRERSINQSGGRLPHAWRSFTRIVRLRLKRIVMFHTFSLKRRGLFRLTALS